METLPYAYQQADFLCSSLHGNRPWGGQVHSLSGITQEMDHPLNPVPPQRLIAQQPECELSCSGSSLLIFITFVDIPTDLIPWEVCPKVPASIYKFSAPEREK